MTIEQLKSLVNEHPEIGELTYSEFTDRLEQYTIKEALDKNLFDDSSPIYSVYFKGII